MVFDPLSHDQLRKVARLQMKDVASRLAERGIALAVTDAALDVVLAESYDPVSHYSISKLLNCVHCFYISDLNSILFSMPGLRCKTH